MASSLAYHKQQTDTKKTDLILIVNKIGLLYKTTGEYPEFETRRPLTGFVSVNDSNKLDFLKSIASNVIHIAIDPLLYDGQFLKRVKDMCVNVKQLTIDGNLLELEKRAYHTKADKPRGEVMCRNLVTFIGGFDKIEELFFGPRLNLAEKIYSKNKWGWGNRFGAKSGFYKAVLSTDFINHLNSNLKAIFFNCCDIDSFDLRDAGHRCPVAIKPMEMSLINQMYKLEGGPAHTCLNKLVNLKSLSIPYFENCFHSDTVGELILETLSGDNRVHQMFPNLKKIRVQYFCPFVMDMSGTANEGLYDGVILDELEVEVQIPCFGRGGRKMHAHQGILQAMLYLSFTKDTGRFNGDAVHSCHCFDTITRIKPLKYLKVIKLRCFDEHVGRFIYELQKSGCKPDIIVYEKSRFERNPDHQSLWNNLISLESTLKFVPHDKIELVMKKLDESKTVVVENKLRKFVPADVKISFTE
ncbi:uncharacterized protein LOC119071754 [Bradysia coprophila]|uniref:uncharacterized protein LOC119071754 n=1 Tax=Bradysia coprophila TaxID=38358 RepID=UPI00187D6E78|nr:uncharacterized protein LOC119071754 [Bradysia coprophila]